MKKIVQRFNATGFVGAGLFLAAPVVSAVIRNYDLAKIARYDGADTAPLWVYGLLSGVWLWGFVMIVVGRDYYVSEPETAQPKGSGDTW